MEGSTQWWRRSGALAMAAVASIATRSGAQSTPTSRTTTTSRPITIGSLADDESRLRELLGDTTARAALARSASTSLDPTAAARRPPRVSVIVPELHTVHNTRLAAGGNDGGLWAGRGVSALVRGGLRATWGPLDIVAMPELTYTQNRAFPNFPGADSTRSSYSSPWHVGRYSADLPLRFGDAPFASVLLGQSSVTLRHHGVAIGASSENEWWGPGIRNGLVLSNNAEGIPHLFARSARPLRTRAGEIDLRWTAGVLTESLYFDDVPTNDYRSFAAMLATFRPRVDGNLTLGIEHAVVAPISSRAGVLGHALDPITRWYGATDDPAADSSARLPLFGLFGRWLFPVAGVEAYAEWTRSDFPRSVRDFFVAPQASQGYTVGLGRATRLSPSRSIVARVELTDVEQTRVFADRPAPIDYYASPTLAQGYTQRGQIIGAAIGPGASSQWISADYVTPDWRLGLFGERVRFENDALYRQRLASPMRHDVRFGGGVRGATSFPDWQLRAELSVTERINYLFQNGSANIDHVRTVDVHDLQLMVDVTPRRRRR